MTTKPKAKKFHVGRKGKPQSDAPAGTEHDVEVPDSEAGPVTEPNAKEMTIGQQIESIRHEGLTGRQLRMARRVAQKYGLTPASDFDAVRLLRNKGLDPFQRKNTLEIIGSKADPQPQTKPAQRSGLPSTQVDTAGARAKAILEIQLDIAKRRQRKLVLLLMRMAFFVMLPTFLVGYYYYKMATPMYATYSQMIIQQANAPGGSKLGGLFSGTGLATSQDSVAVQSYLQSRDAMLRLDNDFGIKAHFAQDWIDPVQRLNEDATNEAAYRMYKRHVKIGYDPTEGIIKMEVIAADPNISASYSDALISYAEERVDNLTTRMRADQMKGADESYEDAEKQMIAAQERVINLKEKSNIISSDAAINLLITKIASLEQVLVQDELNLEELKSNPRPNPAKVNPLERKIASLKNKVAGYYAELTADTDAGESLARITSELSVAQANLETRNVMLQSALEQLETARIEANRQTRYLSLGVSPTAPDEATYPKKFENTLLAFLIFTGIYMMLSLTVSILREQVSS